MSKNTTQYKTQAPAPKKVNLENQYKPVGISAITAATLCKGKSQTAKTGK